jgi:large subunit ribosomal protein L18
MQTSEIKKVRRLRRKTGIRKRLTGTSQRPRLTVFRSLKHIYAQVIDDVTGQTLASAGSVQLKLTTGGSVTGAKEVGKAVAEKAKGAGVAEVAFDRNGFKYHGRVKALADAARAAGLKF